MGQFLTLKNMVAKFFRNSNFSDFLGIKSEISYWNRKIERKSFNLKYFIICNLCDIHDFSKSWMIQGRVKISYLGLYWQCASGKVISYLYLWYIQLKLWPWMDCLLFPQFILIDKHMQRCCPPPPRAKLPTCRAPNNHRARAIFNTRIW